MQQPLQSVSPAPSSAGEGEDLASAVQPDADHQAPQPSRMNVPIWPFGPVEQLDPEVEPSAERVEREQPGISDRASEAPSVPSPATVDLHGVDLHGRVVSSTSGQPLQGSAPLVVLVLPDGGTQGQRGADLAPSATPVLMQVEQRESDLSPLPFAVTSPGRGLRFENKDEICHSYFSSTWPNAFDLGLLNPGESKTVDFQHPGTVQVYCSLHAGKQLSLLVAPTEDYALVQADGSFVLTGLVPGEYTLQVWRDGLRPQRVRVALTGAEREPLLIELDPEAVERAQ